MVAAKVRQQTTKEPQLLSVVQQMLYSVDIEKDSKIYCIFRKAIQRQVPSCCSRPGCSHLHHNCSGLSSSLSEYDFRAQVH